MDMRASPMASGWVAMMEPSRLTAPGPSTPCAAPPGSLRVQSGSV
jgi:hypothetical protein